MYGERNMEIYNTMCKTDSGNLLYNSGNSNRGSVTIQEGGMGGRWEGPEGGGMDVPVADSCCCMTEKHKIL